MRTGRKAIEKIEGDYAQRIGRERLEAMCRALEDLLDNLDPRWSATTTLLPPQLLTSRGSAIIRAKPND